MKLRIFKPALLLIAFFAVSRLGFAQNNADLPDQSSDNKSLKVLNLNLNINMKPLETAMDNLSANLKENFSVNTLTADLSSLKGLGKSLNLSIIDNGDEKVIESNNIQDKIKNYSKSYPADGNDKLVIDNKYGRVTVNTWAKNEFKVDVQIKGYAKDDETAQKMVDAITVSDSKDGDVVSFRTNFNGNNTSNSIWKLFTNMNNNHKVEVNYIIYMPAKNALDIDNRYGATVLPDIDGKVSINSSYGSFEAKTLSHANNEIRVHYGSAHIESLNSCDLDVGYGSLDLGSVDKLTSNISYSTIKIGKIKGSAEMNARYAGGIEIDELDKNFSSFSLNASYSSIKMGINNNATNADFDITVHYGGFDYGSVPVEVTKKSPADSEKGFHPTQNYKGHIGKGSPDKMISIRSSYGGVTFE